VSQPIRKVSPSPPPPRRAVVALFSRVPFTCRGDPSDLDSLPGSRCGRGPSRAVAGGDVWVRRRGGVRPLAAGAIHAGRAPIAQGQGDVPESAAFFAGKPLLLAFDFLGSVTIGGGVCVAAVCVSEERFGPCHHEKSAGDDEEAEGAQ
jgi:hypothetical protein